MKFKFKKSVVYRNLKLVALREREAHYERGWGHGSEGLSAVRL